MKVIDDKKTPWILPIACPHCASSIEVEAKDVYSQSLGSFDEFSLYYFVDCGACQSQIDLTNKLPSWVERQAPRGRPTRRPS